AGRVRFIVFYTRRAFDSREVEFLLSRPISRVSFVLSHALAVSMLALFIGAVVGAAVFVTGPSLWGQGGWLWLFGVMTELVIMANAAFFFAMVISSAVGSAMAVM